MPDWADRTRHQIDRGLRRRTDTYRPDTPH
jgi:hypothetical protein